MCMSKWVYHLNGLLFHSVILQWNFRLSVLLLSFYRWAIIAVFFYLSFLHNLSTFRNPSRSSRSKFITITKLEKIIHVLIRIKLDFILPSTFDPTWQTEVYFCSNWNASDFFKLGYHKKVGSRRSTTIPESRKIMQKVIKFSADISFDSNKPTAKYSILYE